jgi:ATP-dependent DNA helicase RecQ
LTDIGWGEEIRALLDDSQTDKPAPDRILDRALSVLDDWRQMNSPPPGGVVVIESRRRPSLVRSLAEFLAAKWNLPMIGALQRAQLHGSSGKANNARRVAALHAAFAVSAELGTGCSELHGGVLLVDDFVDSGWTMTLAARALRRAGAVSVLPFAIATTGRRD